MAGAVKHFAAARSTSSVVALLSLLALFSAFLLFYYARYSSSSSCLLISDSLDAPLHLSKGGPSSIPPAEYSFLASLEKFLAARALPSGSPGVAAASDGGAPSAAVKALDDSIWKEEAERLYGEPMDPWSSPSVVRIYVYEMPAKFTYDLLWLFRNTYRETWNLTSNGSPVHRLIEQHSVDYWIWADLIAPESERLLKNVIRVHRQDEADLFYIPFFTTISYFLLERQQCKALYREALKWVTDQPAWQRSGGRDHILPVHHPWSFKSVRRFMKKAIWLLPDMDSTGNWYKPGEVWLEKDLILPYVPNVDFCDAQCLHDSQSKRSTLLFFRGRLKRNAGGKIRSKLAAALHDSKNVVMVEGSAGETGKETAQAGMRKSLFCLSPAGDTPSSARLFDVIVSGCIPVIVSDELELPFEGILDYRKTKLARMEIYMPPDLLISWLGKLAAEDQFGKSLVKLGSRLDSNIDELPRNIIKIALFVSSNDAVQPGWLVNFLMNMDSKQIIEMQNNLAKYSRHFLFSSPAQPLGAEDLAWRMIAGKLVNIKLHTRRSQRLVEGSRNLCTCECRTGNITRVP